MLLQPIHHDHPFPFFFVNAAFSAEQCATLDQLFSQDIEWKQRDNALYRCSMSDVTTTIPETFKAEILARMREITGLPLVNRMLVTAQRMLPGQVIGLHSDRPFLGYEIARLVVQLNKQWMPEHGGVLELFSSPEGVAVFSVNPEYNKAVGFLLHGDSYHAVTKVTQPRQTVVFNFWHMANTLELAAHIEALFTKLNFSEFPATLNLVASEAEASLSEDVTLLAGTAAIALHRWGYEAATVVIGYRHSAGLSPCEPSDAETYAAVLLADWVAYLYRDSFDLVRWNNLQRALAGIAIFPRLMPTWQLCLPN